MRTFSLFIHSKRSTTPNLAFEIASDESIVRMMAERALRESPDHLLVEVREADRLLFTLERNGTLHCIPHQPTITDAFRDRFSPVTGVLTLQ